MRVFFFLVLVSIFSCVSTDKSDKFSNHQKSSSIDITIITDTINDSISDANINSNRYDTITTIDLVGNKWTTIPDSIFLMTSLTWLDISENKIKEIPQQISKLVMLKSIILDNTAIKSLPPELFQLPHLEFISMKFCSIDSIPSSVRNAQSLRIVNLERTHIKGISEFLYSLPNLEHLLICDRSKNPGQGVFANKDFHFNLCR
jgi:Leucine-rich repeat (LRR) protein